jgi:hypothetical protein
VAIAAFYLLPLAGSAIATNPNEVARIELAVSIAFWARVDLGSAAEVYGLSEDVSVREGKVFSDKAPGLSITAVPVIWTVAPLLPRASSSDLPTFWPLRHLLTLLLVALPTVGLAFIIAAAVPDADPSTRSAIAVIAALSTPLWTYGSVFFGHGPAALLVTTAWFLLLGFPGVDMALDVRRAAVGGVIAGFAIATEYPTFLLVGVIFGSLLVRRTSPRIVVIAAVGSFLGAMPALLYHQLAFGAPWLTGYALKAHGDFQAIHGQGFFGVSAPTLEGLWGVLFSVRRGIFYYCPLLLLAPVGVWHMVKNRGWRDAGPLLVALATYVFFAAGFVDWTAGWCAAARHLVPIIGLLAVLALFAATLLTKYQLGSVVVAILIAISGTHAVLSLALTPYFPPEFTAPFAQLVLPSLVDGAGFANLVSSGLGTAPWIVAVFSGGAVLLALVWAGGRLWGTTSLWMPTAFIATVALLLSAYWWQGSSPKNEIELMRAQVLRRLGHAVIADRIESSLSSAVTTDPDQPSLASVPSISERTLAKRSPRSSRCFSSSATRSPRPDSEFSRASSSSTLAASLDSSFFAVW